MRQRNDTGSVLHVSAWPTDDQPDRAPFDVGPGEETDFPEPLAGFTALDPDVTVLDAETFDDQGPAEPNARTRTGARRLRQSVTTGQPSDTSSEGGEPA